MKAQRGMTLVELVVTLAITGVIITFLGTAVYHILNVTGSGNDRLIVSHELENAASWFNFDGQQAVSAGGGSTLTLTLSDNSTITYSLSGSELRRTVGGSYITLARNISSLSFSLSGRAMTMSITDTPSGAYNVSQNGSYLVNMRAKATS
jgi:prepilin-type N-terminal cleavage/methylation domain-containing protein